MNTARNDDIVARLLRGERAQEIAKKYGISKRQINKIFSQRLSAGELLQDERIQAFNAERRTANSMKLARNDDIVACHLRGESFQEIAKRHGISKGRVHQVYSQRERITGIAPDKRIKAFNAFMKPYLEVIGENPCCIMCHEPLAKAQRRCGMCKDCRAWIKRLSSIASRIRAYKNTGNRRSLYQASMEIRKWRIATAELKNM